MSAVAKALRGWLMRSARVGAVSTLSPRFRSIELEGEALRGVEWTPGQKIQLAIGTGLGSRTYTPISWDAGAGRTKILAFLHGMGPGSQWAGEVRAGDACQFLGPRRSLEMEPASVLFGDETSFGLAASLPGCRPLFEVTDAEQARTVLDAVGLGRAIVLRRRAGDAHLDAAEAELARFASGDASFVLSGKASSIQRMSRALKAAGVGAARIRAKAYWAPGKAGMD